MAFTGSNLVRGWASLIALECIFSGIILLALGAIGDYVARVYEESKGRPLYIVAETCNLPTHQIAVPRAVILDTPVILPSPVAAGQMSRSDELEVRVGVTADAGKE